MRWHSATTRATTEYRTEHAANDLPADLRADGTRRRLGERLGNAFAMPATRACAATKQIPSATQEPATRAALHLNADSRVLLFGSEGDTDPQMYEKLVGATAAQVRAGHGQE